MHRLEFESKLRHRLPSAFRPSSEGKLSVEERTKLVIFELLLHEIELKAEEELNLCVSVLSDDSLLYQAVKAILVSVSSSGRMGGHLTESMSWKLLKSSNAVSLLVKLGIPEVEFKGVHCAKFFEVACRRKSMSIDLYIRSFLPKFVRSIMNTPERFLICVIYYPLVLTLFHRRGSSACNSREQMVATLIRCNLELIRPMRSLPPIAK